MATGAAMRRRSRESSVTLMAIRRYCYNTSRMQKVKRVYKSFAEAEKANREYCKSLHPAQRLDILLTLIDQNKSNKRDEAGTGLKRIYRVIKRS